MTHSEERTTRVIQYVEEHWRSGNPLKQMSLDVGIDAGDMERLFRGATGVTIKRYIDGRKKDELVDLLRSGETFGYKLGGRLRFRNDEAFYRWVKRVFGIPFKTLRWRCCENQPGNFLRSMTTPDSIHPTKSPAEELHQKSAPKKGIFIRLHKRQRRATLV
jgi:methylphosphotriester-DNA--protein-cysteine methyltransferase